MALRKKRRNPDYAFEKISDEDIKSRRSNNKKILIAVLCAAVIIAALAVVMSVDNVKSSYDTQYPEGELVITFPKDKSEYEIYPSQEFIFDISAQYKINGKTVYYGITDHDRCRIGMFFSDNLLCERVRYDTFVLNENAKTGTEFTVTLKYRDQISIMEFTVIDKPAQADQIQ